MRPERSGGCDPPAGVIRKPAPAPDAVAIQIARTIALSAVVLAGFGTSTAAASTAVRAHTPTGNINCVARNYGGPGWSLTCSADDPGRTMRISTRGDAYSTHYRRVARGRGRTLYHGGTYQLGPYSCDSSSSGLSCSYVPSWASHQVGFWISRESSYPF